jgi:eukaryotic-like serine/threonine-protein kinase
VTQVDESPESPGTPGLLTFGSPDATSPAEGEVLAERYQLQEHINNDSFGRQVWRGVDVVLRRPVAVVMRYPGGAAAVEMLDAAVAASRVVHPHLVDVYDAIDEGTRAYVVREWVDGGSLREYVTEAPLDPDRATTVASSVASAVAAVHASGMAHGNVHPGTVLIGSDGRVVLSDARSDELATPDADVRAVGGVLYYALTGYWPHAEAGASSLPDAARDAGGMLVQPRSVRGGIPGHLSDLATDLLDPNVAPPSADVLAAELNRLEGDRDETFFGASGPLGFEQPSYADVRVPDSRRSVRKLAIGVAALLVLALVGLFIAVTTLSGSPSRPNTAPTHGSTSGGSDGPANGHPTAVPVASNQVRVIDPEGDRTELKNAGLAVDGDKSTVWHTDHYRGSANFGNKKQGMGILIDLGSAKSVTGVQVQFATAGATVELRTGSTDPGPSSGAAGDRQIVQSFQTVGPPHEDAGTNVVLNASGQPVRYLLVWITKLPESTDVAGQYQVQIQDIQVLAN